MPGGIYALLTLSAKYRSGHLSYEFDECGEVRKTCKSDHNVKAAPSAFTIRLIIGDKSFVQMPTIDRQLYTHLGTYPAGHAQLATAKLKFPKEFICDNFERYNEFGPYHDDHSGP
ncbi:hypothetical protein N7519_009999 [Penicillium mononematosum]|uniref:uncharacterized protein n=1 Tax=Penicillium mononematosum TaxID=268346 RepID=UPI002547DC4A|nr:uncharacterized protein N7519_009999 [Penicillium mononematosum]KAJ6179538.1 hypothetical protein N7519_009999 [Penicillium mononematosum]